MNAIKTMLNQYKDKVNEQTKVREILQQLALLGLERHGFFEKAAFYGGTALRILYGLDRFSEDLDFTLLQPDPNFNFAPFLEGMRKELNGYGFELDVEQKNKNIETSVLSAFMKMNTLKLYLTIGVEKKSANHTEKIQIKLEVDTDPPPHSRTMNHTLLNPIPFTILTLHQSDLFAGKMHALLYRAWKGRVKGRDWFDLLWYLKNKIPLSLKYLESCMHQAGNLDHNQPLTRAKLLEMIKTKIQTLNWASAKEDVHSFISNTDQLKIWSPQFFTSVIDQLLIE